MRKVFICVLVMILSVAPALADYSIKEAIDTMNIYSALTGAQKITGEGIATDNNPGIDYAFDISDDVKLHIKAWDREIHMITVSCRNESYAAEFLAQSVDAIGYFADYDTTLFMALFANFLLARAESEKKQELQYVNGYAIQVSRVGEAYLFVIAK